MNAPIVLFVYNRPEHTRRTVTALAENCLASKSDLWVFSDGPKFSSVEPQVSKVRNYVAGISENSSFRSVHVVESQKNKGLANSIIQGVNKVMEKADRVIVLEDDLVTAPDFLNFMNDCLVYYEDMQVGAISGHSPIQNLPDDYGDSVYLSTRNCSHGWATWRNRWQDVDWEAKSFNQFSKNGQLRRQFDSTGADRFDRLRRQIENDIDSWSIRFGFHLFMQNLVVVYPSDNKVSNIGFDGSGVHAKSGKFRKSNSGIKLRPMPYTLSFPFFDTRISRLFYRLYSGGPLRVVARKLRNSRAAFTLRYAKKSLRRSLN